MLSKHAYILPTPNPGLISGQEQRPHPDVPPSPASHPHGATWPACDHRHTVPPSPAGVCVCVITMKGGGAYYTLVGAFKLGSLQAKMSSLTKKVHTLSCVCAPFVQDAGLCCYFVQGPVVVSIFWVQRQLQCASSHSMLQKDKHRMLVLPSTMCWCST